MLKKVLIVILVVLAGAAAFKLLMAKSSNKTREIPKVSNAQVKGVQIGQTSASQTGQQLQNNNDNPKSPSVYLGAWTQGFFDSNTNTLNPQQLINLESMIGKNVAIAHYYIGWEYLASPELVSQLQTIDSNGWRPLVSVNPYFFQNCPANNLPLYRAIANGNCDEFLKTAAKNLKQFSKPVFLRFAWEMNIPSTEWQIEKTGSTNKDFVTAWQRAHNIFYQEGATNVLWVFSPDATQISYGDIYPGDQFVDWVALDGYNWGTTQNWSSWQSFSQVFSQAYSKITQIAPNKPLMLAETNTTNVGGDKALWYQDMLEAQIPQNFPKIKAVVFYNEDRSQKENVNWKIDITQASLEAFSRAIKNPFYSSSF